MADAPLCLFFKTVIPTPSPPRDSPTNASQQTCINKEILPYVLSAECLVWNEHGVMWAASYYMQMLSVVLLVLTLIISCPDKQAKEVDMRCFMNILPTAYIVMNH